MNSMTTKFFVIRVLVLWVGLCLSPPAFPADRIRVGLSSFTPINAALWIAEDKGLFKRHGIESEVVLIGGASAGGVSSLLPETCNFSAAPAGQSLARASMAPTWS